MRKNKDSRYLIIALFVGLAFSLSSCYEPEEGCLDVAAKNFQVDADLNCPDDCCEYPSLKLVLSHRVGAPGNDVPIRYIDSIYTDAQSQVFRLQKMQYYLSNFMLHATDGSTAPVTDLIDVESFNPDGSLSANQLVDDFLLINPSFSNSLTVGEIQVNGTFEAISFSLGLDELANRTDTSSVEEGHPLGSIDDRMYVDEDQGYAFVEAAILRDTVASDTIPAEVRVVGVDQRIDYFIPFGQPFDLNPGFNINISLHINYATWLNAIEDVRNDSPEAIADKIVSGLSQAISLVEISADNI
ncbi:MAG: hypothetical protein HRU41_16315 [Saprospiraceae bacterium]|nr:hypothetical protein [Saprospiraceae bacterium]